ncbi:hypothetical protein BCR37DRAFT_392046 [Protomyces lactucae-debilis]|uniref:Uncharacterized protein n=1 Tax=Protomyces lactucae-debilis TaxID=2754530 RepID=A0A1Y2FM88_PROLT|nr:uncharacterized protein BCR37DRAFT_392046 [Protomyces lactucae-debilis]ORY84474.1 hypothetical protein BCR37DRAFT_392046 [Protomyces lactucae-debilis]
MDLSSLSSNLPPRRPPPSEDPINIAFKEAALSLTTLYKASQGARTEGYKDAVDDMYNLFCNPAEAPHNQSAQETLDKLKHWLEERRRRSAELAADEAVAQQQQEAAHLFETEAVLPTLTGATTLPPAAATGARFNVHPHSTRHRQRTSSPVMPHRTYPRGTNTADRHERQSSEESERRDRDRSGSAVKRRVLGPFDSLNEFHKRGRFG